MKPIIDHIQLTVKNPEAAEAFDDKLMPVLGFDLAKKSKGTVEAHEFDVVEYFYHMFHFENPKELFNFTMQKM